MIKELHRGIYTALEHKDIPLLESDLTEPKTRPAFKIYIKPTASQLNMHIRKTTYAIMLLHYASDKYQYYIEQYEMMEHITDALLDDIELDNGVWVEIDDIDFETDDDLLIAYFNTTVFTRIDTEEDNELMWELKLTVNEAKRVPREKDRPFKR